MLERAEAEDFMERMRRVRMAGDLEGAMDLFDDEAVFTLVGLVGNIRGKSAIRDVLADLIDNYEFLDWQPISLFVDGDGLAVRHRLKVRHVPSGQVVDTESCEFVTLKQGRVETFTQYADTAAIAAFTA